jgi:hypothetical protein
MHSTTITTAVVLATIYVVCTAEEHHKRAPSGFTGVRGKKSIPDSAYSTGNAESDATSELKADVVSDVGAVNKRAPSGFMGMRGKKPYPVWEGTYPDEVYKRAPSGFMGMRGKKDMEFTNYGKINSFPASRIYNHLKTIATELVIMIILQKKMQIVPC